MIILLTRDTKKSSQRIKITWSYILLTVSAHLHSSTCSSQLSVLVAHVTSPLAGNKHYGGAVFRAAAIKREVVVAGSWLLGLLGSS